MRKKLALILALMLAASISACGTPANSDNPDTDLSADGTDSADTTESTDNTTANTPDTTDEPKSYTVSLDNGITFEIGAAASDIIASLGEPLDYMEAPSCVHTGYDKVYVFENYSVNTSPDANGGDYISEFSILTDAIAFESGFTIGSLADDATAEFGTDYTEQFGVRTYTLGAVSASIILDGDTVMGITVSSNR